MIAAPQIRAARALLNWNQSELADRAGLTQSTIANLELGKHAPSKSTSDALRAVFERAGVELLDDEGVRRARGIREYRGPEAVLRLLDDVRSEFRHKAGELLIIGADERQNREGVEDRVARLRSAGVSLRLLIEEGNNYLLGPLEEYRHLPRKYFKNNPTFIFGDCIAIVITNESSDFIQVIKSEELAESQRRLFEFIWDKCEAISSRSRENISANRRKG